jgi:hypothetical protein
MAKVIKLSPVIQAPQLTALFVGDDIWQQEQCHTSFVTVALAEFRFHHLGEHFYGTKLL